MSKARETANITTSDQTIAGVKTFSDKPQVPNASTGTDAVNFSQVIGLGQSWQDVISSRSGGVTYTNTTGKPIFVFVTYGQSGTTAASIVLDGVTASSSSTHNVSSSHSVSFVVRNGGTYLVNMSGGKQAWIELR